MLLQYGSRRQRTVTNSSFAAEVYAMLEGVRAAKELAVIHALINYGNQYKQAPVDVYSGNISLYNMLDADGVVQPKEECAAVQELREHFQGCTMSTVTWLRAHDQLADALTKPGRYTPLQQTIRTGAYAVRLAATDYLTKRPSAAPDQDGVIDYDDHDANAATNDEDCADASDNANTDDDTGGKDMGEYEYGRM